MKSLFEELLETSYVCTNKINQTNVSIQDNGDSWIAEVILAGFSKKDIKKFQPVENKEKTSNLD